MFACIGAAKLLYDALSLEDAVQCDVVNEWNQLGWALDQFGGPVGPGDPEGDGPPTFDGEELSDGGTS